MDDRTDGSPSRTGRLHGRLLQVLALVSVIAALVAVWQFSPMLLRGEEEASATWPWEDPTTVGFSGEPSSEAAVDSAEASSASAEPSPEAETTEAEPETPPASSEPATAEEDGPEGDEPGGDGSGDATGDEAEPEGPVCTASLALTKDWRGAMEVWVRVVNTGEEPFERWEVTIAIDGADLYEHWGMDRVDGDRYESARWNGELDPGEAADAGFQAATEHGVEVPETVPCRAFG